LLATECHFLYLEIRQEAQLLNDLGLGHSLTSP
jgi:hypothetical protein